jgi:hypothetical protein
MVEGVLGSLSLSDLAEAKSYPNPPTILKEIFGAIMAFLNCDESWFSVKKVLSEPK